MPAATTSGASVVIGSDHLELDCHGILNTHLDGLSHVGLDGTWYGGWALDDSAGPSIVDLAGAGLVTRAVHVDIPAVRGTEWVGIDEPVCGADIDAALAASGVTFESGDALLLDMGRDRYEAAGHSWSFERNPGVGADERRGSQTTMSACSAGTFSMRITHITKWCPCRGYPCTFCSGRSDCCWWTTVISPDCGRRSRRARRLVRWSSRRCLSWAPPGTTLTRSCCSSRWYHLAEEWCGEYVIDSSGRGATSGPAVGPNRREPDSGQRVSRPFL